MQYLIKKKSDINQWFYRSTILIGFSQAGKVGHHGCFISLMLPDDGVAHLINCPRQVSAWTFNRKIIASAYTRVNSDKDRKQKSLKSFDLGLFFSWVAGAGLEPTTFGL